MSGRTGRSGRARFAGGVALIMVLIVISALAMIGAPFVLSMMLHERASTAFAGEVRARLGARAARNHAIAGLRATARPVEWAAEAAELEAERPRASGRGRLTDSRRRSFSERRGTIVRRDLGDAPSGGPPAAGATPAAGAPAPTATARCPRLSAPRDEDPPPATSTGPGS